jgi:hypothetical protein
VVARFKNLEAEAKRTRKEQSFLVPVEEIRENDYDLSINKYKEVERVKVEYDAPEVIFGRIASLQEEINNAMDEFLQLVISSADTMYNTLKGYIDTLSASTESIATEIDGRLTNEIVTERERIDELSAYTMNLKLSDHFMITDDEYRMLSVLGVLDGDNISNLTYDLNGLEQGSIIYYNDEIYYCIYDENGGGGGGGDTGSTPTITGTTLEIQYIISGGTIILDESVTIEDHTVILPIGGGDQGGDAEVNGNTIEDDSVYIDSEDEHTLVLGNNYTYDEENNTIIIN